MRKEEMSNLEAKIEFLVEDTKSGVKQLRTLAT